MKLITELNESVETVIEEGVNGGPKSFFIEGIFMQTESLNKNGRKYPKGLMEREINNFMPYVLQKSSKALGELGHPDTPTINADRASHLITGLRFEGNDIIGKAKLLDTPMGRIAKEFVSEGIKMGVSSRGVGSLKLMDGYNLVQNDFRFATVDIVTDPSAHKAVVNGIMENAEWLYIEGQGWISQYLDESKKQIRQATKSEIEAVSLKIFENLLKRL